MRYPERWKARRVSYDPTHGIVSDDRGVRGHVHARQVPGAKSPGGMITNKVWEAHRVGLDGVGPIGRDFPSLTEAMAFVLNYED